MAIGDILFSLMGQPNPQAQLARGMNNYVGQVGSDAGIVPGPDAGLAGPALAKSGGAGAPGQMPNTAAAMQQNAPPPQPQQPQAYQSPPDLTNIYLKLMQRQQANAQINTGLGLLAGAFSHNQADRENMSNAMSNLNASAPNAGEQIGNIMQLQQVQWQRQMMMAQMQHLPEIAKQLNITPEMATGLFMSGKLGDVMQNIAQNQYQQGTPEYKANVGKAIAETGLTTAQTGAVAPTIAKTEAETGETQARTAAIPATTAKTVAETGAIPADVALKQAQTQVALASVPKTQADVANIQAQTTKTLQDVGMPTEQIKNYTYYANSELANKNQPVSFGDWVASGGMNPTEQMKDYRFAMAQNIQAGKPTTPFADWAASQAGAREAASQAGLITTKTRIDAANALPGALTKLKDAINEAESIKSDQNIGSLTGLKALVPIVPGSSRETLQTRIDRLRGIGGIGAVDDLKGGVGRILGSEFTESMAAQSRINQHLGTDPFKDAVTDYENKLLNEFSDLYSRAQVDRPKDSDAVRKMITGGSGGGPSAPKVRQVIRNSKGELEYAQ